MIVLCLYPQDQQTILCTYLSLQLERLKKKGSPKGCVCVSVDVAKVLLPPLEADFCMVHAQNLLMVLCPNRMTSHSHV